MSGPGSLSFERLGSGPRLVLLHGGPGLDHHVMVPLANGLSQRVEVLLPDLPGHGLSRAAGGSPPDLRVLVDETATWLDALDPAPAVLAGHSLGAWVVRELLRGGRAEPSAAILLAPPAGSRDGEGGTRFTRPGRAKAGSPRMLRAELLAFAMEGNSGRPSAPFLRAVADARLRRPEEYVDLGAQLDRVLRGPIPPCRAVCPTLILSGDQDRISSPASVARLAAATEGSQVRILEGRGHVPFASGARPVAEAILEFLSGCGLPARARG